MYSRIALDFRYLMIQFYNLTKYYFFNDHLFVKNKQQMYSTKPLFTIPQWSSRYPNQCKTRWQWLDPERQQGVHHKRHHERCCYCRRYHKPSGRYRTLCDVYSAVFPGTNNNATNTLSEMQHGRHNSVGGVYSAVYPRIWIIRYWKLLGSHSFLSGFDIYPAFYPEP